MGIPAGAIVDAASGAAYVILGAGALAARPTRRATLLFGLFAFTLGFGFLVSNLAAGDRRAAIATAALFVPAGVALTLLSPGLPAGERLRREGLAFAFGAAVLTVFWRVWGNPVTQYCLAMDAGPGNCADGVAELLAPSGGDTLFSVADSLLLGATVFALVVLALQYPAACASGPREAALAVALSAALLLYPGVRAGIDLTRPSGFTGVMGLLGNDGFASLLVLCGVGLLWLRNASRAAAPDAARARNVVLATFGAPALGISAASLLGGWLEAYESGLVGATRIASACLFAHAFLARAFLDFDAGSRRSLRPVVFGAVLLASAPVAFVATRNPVVGLLVASLALAVVYPIQLLPDPSREGEMDTRRRHGVYRAALAEADTAAPSSAAMLAALRARLAISEREHALLAAEIHGGRLARYEIGESVLGKYRIEAFLGEGGFGRTFLARDERVERHVVLKVARAPTPRESARLLREARLLAKLSHANVLTIHDVEEVGGDVVLVLEHAEGGPLAACLARGPLPLAEAARITDDVLQGLAAAHARGIVHRDVKPSNVLLKEGRAKVADFGIALDPVGTGTVTGLSFSTTGAGTVRYMAPEQARGGVATPKSDLYSVAVVLVECVGGRFYLDLAGKGEFEVRRAIVEDAPRLPLDEAPGALNALLRQALAKDPRDRPESAEAFRRALADAVPALRR